MSSKLKCILCVEYEPEMIDLMRLILGRRGFEVKGASGGVEGLKMIREEKPDLVLLDLMLPDIDGREVLRQMQKTKETKNIPVVLLSGNTDLATTEESLQSGATQVLVKPINPEQLIAVLRHVLS